LLDGVNRSQSGVASALKVDSELGGHLPPVRLIQVPV
jgi:hypothetical protein